MKLLIDFFPVLLFFITFKLYDLYVATIAAIIASIAQVVLYWIKNRRFESMHLLTMLSIVILGGATLLLQNDLFIKWKPTAINWLFALIFLGSYLFTKKPLIQRMMEKNIELPTPIWHKLNWSWILFFVVMGFANLYVVYTFDTNTWVNFKFFGVLGLTMVFVLLQAVYLSRHVDIDSKVERKS